MTGSGSRELPRQPFVVFDLEAVDPELLVVLAAALVLVQTALVVGFLVPGGKAAVLSGALAGVGQVHVAVAYAGIVAAAVLGAGIGYGVGRLYGDRIFDNRLLRRHRARIDAAQDLVRRRAAFALVVGRSIAFLRATSPAVAGAAGVPVRTFALWNVVGALAWGSATVGLGYLGGSSITAVLAGSPRTTLLIGAASLALVLVFAAWKRRVRQTQACE